MGGKKTTTVTIEYIKGLLDTEGLYKPVDSNKFLEDVNPIMYFHTYTHPYHFWYKDSSKNIVAIEDSSVTFERKYYLLDMTRVFGELG